MLSNYTRSGSFDGVTGVVPYALALAREICVYNLSGLKGLNRPESARLQYRSMSF